MIYELKSEEFPKCQPLVIKGKHIEIQAIIAGNNPGRIFVDNRFDPTSGFVWFGNLDGFAFIGNVNNETFTREVDAFFNNEIIGEAKRLGLQWFEGFGHDPSWDSAIEKMFNKRNLEASKQRVYLMSRETYQVDREPQIEQTYLVEKLTAERLASEVYQKSPFLQNKLLHFWRSEREFLEKGLGYCIVYEKEIVSVCFSGFVANQYHGIDIETVPHHQGNKLARKLAHRFVKDALVQNLVPYWDCMEVNAPSLSVAESVGFELQYQYTVYEFPFT
ncbi:GNAT family N-acetyltransferase [Alkalihalobacterium sp. APHAB7]|uniref:GNAT family N-acetyltransferase n=1 Tax=Alkalihalobacterium sp. APHAB7 TaxID=3402081 RepID=UPI003AAACBFC